MGERKTKVAVVGAGIAGIAAARRAIRYGLECTIFECIGSFGGTWVYTENAFTDEFDNPVHSSLFASVRSLTPVQLMEMEGLEFAPKNKSSYPGHAEVLEYLQTFAKKYRLENYVKFYHKVLKISRESDDWKLSVKNLKENTVSDHRFDAVMLCNGRHSKPKVPRIPGMETFTGNQIHSHNYRRSEPYEGRRLLVVGAGTSAIEISLDCCRVVQKSYLAYRSAAPKTELGEKIEIKPRVTLVDGDKVHFQDGSHVRVDSIVYCTGYEYDCSVLDPSCGIELVDGAILKPLYKMFVNAAQPTMCILGLATRTIIPALADLQAELFAKHLAGIVSLPSTEEMARSFRDEYRAKSEAGVGAADFYNLGLRMKEYFDEIAGMAKTKSLPPVKFRLREYSREYRKKHYATFREQRIEIIDDENFECRE